VKIRYITPVDYCSFEWGVCDVGFGQVGFYMDGDKLMCNNELLSKQFIKELLCAMVDAAEMEIPNEKDLEKSS
jgi:hypothetical protein